MRRVGDVATVDGVEGIDVVYDSHLVSALYKSVRESLDADGVAAKAIGRVEGRRETESQSAHAEASLIVASAAHAPRSHVRLPAASRAARLNRPCSSRLVASS